MHNDSDEVQVIHPGDRIAQMILHEYVEVEFEEDELSKTSRGFGGFGSTGR